MSRLVPLHWKRFEKFLVYVGCQFEREKGDHRIYWRDDLSRPVVVPRDTQLPVFIIRNNLRLLNISAEEFLEILEKTSTAPVGFFPTQTPALLDITANGWC